MNKISEQEFAEICRGIYQDRESIFCHNPIGTREETLLWMLLSCLISYLSLSEVETPCFTGMPDENTYRNAIVYVLRDRREGNFPIEEYLNSILKNDN